ARRPLRGARPDRDRLGGAAGDHLAPRRRAAARARGRDPARRGGPRHGEGRPILIEILMNNSSGLYQVDGLLKAKLRGSGLEPYVEVVAHIDTEEEKRLVPMV